MRLTDAQLREIISSGMAPEAAESMAAELLVHRSGFLGKKVWVAEIRDEHETRFAIFKEHIDAMTAAADMMIEVYGKPGDACEGDDPTQFRTIENYGGRPGLTKIIWVTEGFFPGAAEANIYAMEVK